MGADQTVAPDRAVIEHPRSHPDQRVVANGAAMQHGLMADGAIAPDGERRSHVGMQHAAILDVASFADQDELIVTAQHRAEPDAGIALELHFADDDRIGRNPVFILRRKLGHDAIERIDRHAPTLSVPN